MRKKRRKDSSSRSSGEPVHHASSSSAEFYATRPSEKPLYDKNGVSNSNQVHRTSRHQASEGRRAEKMDTREKLALMTILKSIILIFLLGIAFFMLWKGINLYEESVRMDYARESELIPDEEKQEEEGVARVEGFDIQNQDARKNFSERVGSWREADRLVRSADALAQRNINDQAIEFCQNALRLDPTHMGALERLGKFHFEKKNYTEAVNAYVDLLSIDPSKSKVQKRLIQALDAFGDAEAVMYMAEWHLERNLYDAEVQLHLANARYAREEFAEAAEAYGRILHDTPKDIPALERQALSFMKLGEYENALVPLDVLRENNYREKEYYRQIAVCNAQLLHSKESLQALGRAAQLFNKTLVVEWLRDSQFDSIRTDRAFQAFVDRIAGAETRLLLERLASNHSEKEEADSKNRLLDVDKRIDLELLKPRK